jgi:hypothetical protein
MRMVTIEKEGNNYTVNPNASPSGNVRLYAFVDGWGSFPYWASKQELEVGDILAGSEYEESSLQNVITISEIKTIAELKELISSNIWNNFDDDVKGYLVNENFPNDANYWKMLASDHHNYSGTTYIDF